MRTVERVRALVPKVFFRDEELPKKDRRRGGTPPENAIIVEGIVSTFGFHRERLEAARHEIETLISETVPDAFFRSKGGGWSFLNLCLDRHGDQWGEQRDAEFLFAMGVAIGRAGFCMAPELFRAAQIEPYVWFDLGGDASQPSKPQASLGLIDPARMRRAVQIIEAGTLLKAFSPAGDEDCLTCTEPGEPTSRRELFFTGLDLGRQVADFFPTGPLCAALPLPWCEECTGHLATMIVAFSVLDAAHRFDVACLWCEGVRKSKIETDPAVNSALMGMTLGMIVREPKLCGECSGLSRELLTQARRKMSS